MVLHAVSDARWPFDVFISHAGEQKPFAQELRQDLRFIGIRAFVDKDDLQAGDRAEHIMLELAKAAPIGVACFSCNYFQKVCFSPSICMHVHQCHCMPVLVVFISTSYVQ